VSLVSKTLGEGLNCSYTHPHPSSVIESEDTRCLYENADYPLKTLASLSKHVDDSYSISDFSNVTPMQARASSGKSTEKRLHPALIVCSQPNKLVCRCYFGKLHPRLKLDTLARPPHQQLKSASQVNKGFVS
jgi:hypothetical protein